MRVYSRRQAAALALGGLMAAKASRPAMGAAEAFDHIPCEVNATSGRGSSSPLTAQWLELVL